MKPFEALYGRRCRSTIGWLELGEAILFGPDLAQESLERVNVMRARLLDA